MLSLCYRMRWSLEYFAGLSREEQETWLDFHHEKQQQMDGVIQWAQESTNEDGTVSGEIVTARALLALLRLG